MWKRVIRREPPKKLNPAEGAIHIAVASFNSLDALVSLNLEHIVKLKIKRDVNTINVLLGHNELEIVEPSMF